LADKPLLQSRPQASAINDAKTIRQEVSIAYVESGYSHQSNDKQLILEESGMMPREKLLRFGAATLSDEELVAIFLRTGVKGVGVVALAAELLASFNGLRGLLQASAEEVICKRGVGPAKFSQLMSAVEIVTRYLATPLERGDAITDPEVLRQYLMLKLKHYQREVFSCLFLDNQHRLIRYEEMFFGTIDGASVHPREVVKRSLELNAAAIVFAHNHPSGVAEPSQADRRITQRLQAALSLVDVRVLDHMVIGDADVISFAERGFL
jgi:DNA repair protein RadC